MNEYLVLKDKTKFYRLSQFGTSKTYIIKVYDKSYSFTSKQMLILSSKAYRPISKNKLSFHIQHKFSSEEIILQ
jgi:hypothetical protein